MLESSDIKIIQAIAELGSISKAATKLNVSQPTLSKRVARLEQVVNLTLFHRNNDGMQVTEAAQYLMDHGKPILAKLDSMVRHLEMLADLEVGRLNIGVGPIIEQLYFPKVLLDYTEETSDIDVSLTTESDDKLLELLLSGDIDVGIGPFQPDLLPNELFVSPVQSANIIFVARKDHPILEEGKLSPQEMMAKYPAISPSIPKSFLQMLPEQVAGFSTKITCDNYHTSKSVVQFSDYLTGGPELLFEKELREGTLVEIPTDINLVWTSHCVARPESMAIPSVKKFLEVFERYLDAPLPSKWRC